MKGYTFTIHAVLVSCFFFSRFNAEAQQQLRAADQNQLSPHAGQVAGILGIKPLVDRAMALSASRPAGTLMNQEELGLRQEISESILAAGFDVDGVLAEIDEERARVIEARAYLQARRDRGVNLTSLASLITGSGVGIAVNALQFSSSTANVGNGIGVGSGIGSTILSFVGIRLQRGPAQPLGSAPNMLAVPFGRKPVLSSDYPQDVLAYLNSVPPGEALDRGSRLQQLMREWVALGRLDQPGTPKGQKEIDLMTASLDPKQKLHIDDLTNRALMLADVAGRVALMKRDLAELLRAIRSADKRHGVEMETPARDSNRYEIALGDDCRPLP
jgi:hypothetical protein